MFQLFFKVCVLGSVLLVGTQGKATPKDGDEDNLMEQLLECEGYLSNLNELQKQHLAAKGLHDVPLDIPFMMEMDGHPGVLDPHVFAQLMLAHSLEDFALFFKAEVPEAVGKELHLLESFDQDLSFEIPDRKAFLQDDFKTMGARRVFDRPELFGAMAKLMVLGVQGFEKDFFRSAGYQVHWNAGYDTVIYRIKHQVIPTEDSEHPIESFVIVERGRGHFLGGFSPGFPLPSKVDGDEVSYRDTRPMSVSFYTEKPSGEVEGKRFVYQGETLMSVETVLSEVAEVHDFIIGAGDQARERATVQVAGFLDRQFTEGAYIIVKNDVNRRHRLDSSGYLFEERAIASVLKTHTDHNGHPIVVINDDDLEIVEVREIPVPSAETTVVPFVPRNGRAPSVPDHVLRQNQELGNKAP